MIVLLLLLLLLLGIRFIYREHFKDIECVNVTKEDAFRKLLQYWAQFAEKHCITYSISDGTLLGWYRENGEFIGHDGDMDAMINKTGVDTLMKLAKDPAEKRIIFTKDLKATLPWKPNDIKIIVIYKKYYVDCKGDRVYTYKGTCSLGIPKFGGGELYARVIYNNPKHHKYHLDLFAKQKYLSYFSGGIKECTLEGIKTKCWKDTGKYIPARYGEDWNIPWKRCDKKTKKWYKNKKSPHYENDPDAR